MLESGDLVGGDFEIVRPLSQGGMGAVYVARQRSTDATRVVKVMLPSLVKSPELRERFEREARASGRIASEHVVKMIAYGVDAARGLPWLAMEYLPGATLEERVVEGGPPSPELLYEILRQLFHGVAAAHAAGIVHRDLKPNNVYVADAQRADVPFTVKVLDFGIAKVLDPNQQGTRAMGTRAWMAPEQERVDIPISPAADVWALGLIVYWLLAGRPFWRNAAGTESMLSYEMHFAPIPPASLRSHEHGAGPRHSGFDAWFGHAVARDPGSRFRDARAAWEALAPMLGEVARPSLPSAPLPYQLAASMTTAAPLSQATAAGSTPEPKRGRAGLFMGAVVLAGALIGTALLAARALPSLSELRAASSPLPAATAPAASSAIVTPSATPEPSVAPPPPPTPPPGMVFVPPSSFIMGRGDKPPHGPQREVRLTRGFFMDRYETTVAEYRECITKKACTPSSVHGPRPTPEEVATFTHFCTAEQPGHDQHPINCVDRSQAQAYCRFRKGRLPTEAEWELAARGTDGRTFPWGNAAPTSCDMAVISGLCPATGPRTVGRRAPSSASPFGVFDMSGNLWEWVQDTYDPQLALVAPAQDPIVRGVSGRGVLRGGSWDFAASHASTSQRLPFDPAEGHVGEGFRCAADAPNGAATKTDQ